VTSEQAIRLANSNFWEQMSFREIAEFQISEERLCMPFEIFHNAVEKTIGRPVFTHEFGLNIEGLRKEIFGNRNPPSFDEIINLIPEDKRFIVKI
jgi:hypothetical protein